MSNIPQAPAPGIVEILLQVLLSTLVGVGAAFLFLVIQPVEVVQALPAESDKNAGVRYVVLGEASNARNVVNRWERLLGDLEARADYELLIEEDDLNHWARAKFQEPDDDRETPFFGEVMPRDLNFRLEEDRLYIFLNIDYRALGFEQIFQLQIRGTFEERRDKHRFAIDHVYLGHSRIPPVPGLRSFFLNRIRESYPVPPGLKRIIEEAQTLRIESGRIAVQP